MIINYTIHTEMQATVKCVGYMHTEQAWLYEWEERYVDSDVAAVDGEILAWNENGEAMLDPDGYVPPEEVVKFVEQDILKRTIEAFE